LERYGDLANRLVLYSAGGADEERFRRYGEIASTIHARTET
jgi:hypothetical protein